MSKIIHIKLHTFIKYDAKIIKNNCKDLKLAEIQNGLSTIFGWRHFNELEKNIKNNIDNKEFLQIKTMSFQDLLKLKQVYFKKVYEIFHTDKEIYQDPYSIDLLKLKQVYFKKVYEIFHTDKEIYQDPYSIRRGLFYSLINKKKIIIKHGVGVDLNLNFIKNKHSILLSNKEIEYLINDIISGKDKDMWRERSKSAINGLLEALKDDDRVLSYQDEINKCFSFEYLVDYLKNHPSKNMNSKKLYSLYNYVINTPGFGLEYFESDVEIDKVVQEQHGYVFMSFLMLKQNFLTQSIQNEKIYTLDELKAHNGNIIVEHYNKGDIEINLNIMSRLI